jgi:hypothetical protein
MTQHPQWQHEQQQQQQQQHHHQHRRRHRRRHMSSSSRQRQQRDSNFLVHFFLLNFNFFFKLRALRRCEGVTQNRITVQKKLDTLQVKTQHLTCVHFDLLWAKHHTHTHTARHHSLPPLPSCNHAPPSPPRRRRCTPHHGTSCNCKPAIADTHNRSPHPPMPLPIEYSRTAQPSMCPAQPPLQPALKIKTSAFTSILAAQSSQ